MAPSTIDALLGGRIVLEQPARGFRASIDAVLLAAAVDVRQGSSVLDAGCGTGAAALCLAWRRPDLVLTGLEIDLLTTALARGNVERNGRSPGQHPPGTVTVVAGDLMAPPDALSDPLPDPLPDVLRRPFAAVMTNPPFHPPTGEAARNRGRAVATVDAAGPAGWLGACLRRLAPGGRLVLIHRADRLPRVLAALEPGAGAIEIIPLWPKTGSAAAKRVIVRCRKGARSPAILRRGLVLHGRTGIFTEAAEAILRHGAALDDVLEVG